MNTKTIFSALALAVALGAAAPAFADRYYNPEQYGVEYTGDATSVSLAEQLNQHPETIEPTKYGVDAAPRWREQRRSGDHRRTQQSLVSSPSYVAIIKTGASSPGAPVLFIHGAPRRIG